MSVLWLSKQTPDGRWTYGYGEYNKSIASMVSSSGGLGFVYQVAIGYLTKYPTIEKNSKVPTYYIWGVDPYGQKRIGGEWNLLTGGKNAMLAYFKSFDPAFASGLNDKARVDLIAGSRDKVKVAPLNPSTADSQGAVKPNPDAPSEGGGFMVPLLIAGVALVLLLR